jgi:flagellar basal-body rod modification protein FlgD
MTVSSTTTPAATSASSTSSSSAAASTSANALTALSGNFNDFLSLLTTQLQNQDPTSPLDTSQFTSELVEFTGVEQQIDTNASLTSLIQATQGTEVIQATAITGKPVVVTSPDLALQNGAASINYTATSAGPVTITVSNSSGVAIKTAQVNATAGSNSWAWDGTSDSGVQEPDGSYAVTVSGTSAGAATTLPFTVNGTATGVTNNNGTVSLDVGALSVGFSNVVSVGQ